MNTGQLAAAVAESTGLDKNQARDAVNALIFAIQKEVKGGGKVALAGFGTFGRTSRKARVGRNPKTGESVKIPSKKVPKFIAGRVFKEVVNGARKVDKPEFLTKALTKKKLLELCKIHGVDVQVGKVAKKAAAPKKVAKKVSKKPAKAKTTVQKQRVPSLKAAAKRRKK